MRITQLAHTLRKLGARPLLVATEIMLEGRHDHSRRIATYRLQRLLQAVQVVVVEVHEMGPIFGGDA